MRVYYMKKKWVVVYEYDLEKGLCFIAKKDAGKGEVAFFDSRKEAVKWVASWENIDKDLWDINYIKLEV